MGRIYSLDWRIGLTVELALLVAMLAAPRPYGYLVALAMPLFRKQIRWASTNRRYILAGLAAYVTTFLADYIYVGPPHSVPPWWEAVVLAPIAEEFLFRALPFSLLPAPAAWLISVPLFGALHPANPVIASLYGFSLTLAYRGGGYAASVALHSFNNALWIALATRSF
ncbi:MAG: CPBP family intramembrane glutamic endopeptidase [Pyrobaculum sp.]